MPRATPGLLPADLYFRRTMWLIVFGLVNAYVLLWPGDILYYYGVVGLLLFVFRNVTPRKLIVAAAVIMVLQTAVTVTEWYGYREASERRGGGAGSAQRRQGADARHRARRSRTFARTNEEFKPSREELEKTVSRVRKSYAQRARRGRTGELALRNHVLLPARPARVPRHDAARHGAAEVRRAHRRSVAARVRDACCSSATRSASPVNLFETPISSRGEFAVESLIASYLTYDLGRIPMTLGHIGLIGLLYQTSALSAAMRTSGTVGQMALTNYLTQSVICMFLFTGAGLALYGQAGAPRALLRRRGDLDRAADLEPAVAASLPLRSGRMGVAIVDVLAEAADAQRR